MNFYLFVGRPGVLDGANSAAPFHRQERDGPDLAQASDGAEATKAQASWKSRIILIYLCLDADYKPLA